MKITHLTLILTALFAVILGCGNHESAAADDGKIKKAIAVLHPTENNEVSGTVTFTVTADGMRVEAHLQGLQPGEHGFHVHEFGDCTAPAGTSAGGHFNPFGSQHGAPSSGGRHVGDLGNIEVDEEGNARVQKMDRLLAFEGAASIIGRAVVVHEKRDDLTSQPTGNAGGRVACGVIGIAQMDPL